MCLVNRLLPTVVSDSRGCVGGRTVSTPVCAWSPEEFTPSSCFLILKFSVPFLFAFEAGFSLNFELDRHSIDCCKILSHSAHSTGVTGSTGPIDAGEIWAQAHGLLQEMLLPTKPFPQCHHRCTISYLAFPISIRESEPRFFVFVRQAFFAVSPKHSS